MVTVLFSLVQFQSLSQNPMYTYKTLCYDLWGCFSQYTDGEKMEIIFLICCNMEKAIFYCLLISSSPQLMSDINVNIINTLSIICICYVIYNWQLLIDGVSCRSVHLHWIVVQVVESVAGLQSLNSVEQPHCSNNRQVSILFT